MKLTRWRRAAVLTVIGGGLLAVASIAADIQRAGPFVIDAQPLQSEKRAIFRSTGTDVAASVMPQADTAKGLRIVPWSGGATGYLAQLEGTTHTTAVTAAGRLGVGTGAPDTPLNVRYGRADVFSAGSWSGELSPPPGVLIDNPQAGGYDAGLAFRQATSTGVLKTAGFVNLIGSAAWTNGILGSQISTLQLGVRDDTDTLRSRLEVDYQGTTAFLGSRFGASARVGVLEEEVTLSTVGTTTDSTASLLPAGAIILAVTARVTQTITTATDWSLGDPTTAARFSAAETILVAGTTKVGLNHQKGGVATDAAGPTQATAAKVRITTTGTPGAGKIRVCVHYLTFQAPTS